MRILIIEDEPKTGDYLRQGLQEAGFGVDLARNGPDGLHLALTSEPDLVLLDVMLPEVSGYEICEGIRTDPSLSDVKVLMMTARGSTIERRKGLALGADGFISKPFELKDLRDEVRRLLTGAG